MNCPGPDDNSYTLCLCCLACYPGLSPRVQELLDVSMKDADYITTEQIVEGVMS